jgi:hypothetical protein
MPNELIMRANRNNIFHIQCFKCIICDKQLNTGDEYGIGNLNECSIYCRLHYLSSLQQQQQQQQQSILINNNLNYDQHYNYNQNYDSSILTPGISPNITPNTSSLINQDIKLEKQQLNVKGRPKKRKIQQTNPTKKLNTKKVADQQSTTTTKSGSSSHQRQQQQQQKNISTSNLNLNEKSTTVTIINNHLFDNNNNNLGKSFQYYCYFFSKRLVGFFVFRLIYLVDYF